MEGRYPQLDLEALAVDYGLRRFRFYLVGAPEVKVVTDHKPLIAIFENIRRGSSRTERIKLRHQEINYKVEWQKGKTNKADYLSRHATPWKKVSPEEKEETNEFEKTVWFTRFSPYTEAVSIQEMVKQTQLDPELSALKKALRKGYASPKCPILAPYWKIWDSLTVTNEGLVLKDDRIILPDLGKKLGKFKKCLKWLYTTFVAIIYHYNPFLVEKHTKKFKILNLEIFHR